MPAIFRCCVALVVSVASWAGDAIPLADFEGDSGKAFESPPGATLSTDHARSGTHALKLVQSGEGYPGLVFASGGQLALFRQRPIFAVDVFNPQDTAVTFSVRADDANSKDYGSRYNDDGYTARPGWSTLRINLTGLLCSNSRNFHDQRKLDMSTLRLFNVFMSPNAGGPARTLYFDDARLEGTGLPEVPGLLAFDFGPTGSGVFSGFTGVNEQDAYTPERGWGWRGGASGNRTGNPDDLGGDYCIGDTFLVDLKEGAGTYVVELGIDTFGAWGSPQYFRHRTVTLNGASALDETMDEARFLATRYLRFEDDDDDPGIDLWERRVKPATAARRFEATVAKDGKLAVRVAGDGSMGGAMCWMLVYPKARHSEGEAFSAALDRRRKELFTNEVSVMLPKADHPAPKPTADEQARGVIAFARSSDLDIAATSAPDERERPAALALTGCRGERLSAQIGLWPLRALEHQPIRVSDLTGAGAAVIRSSAVQARVVRNLAKRGGIGREASLTPLILRPATEITLKPEFTRSVWVTVALPTDAAPGEYAGSVSIGDGAKATRVPLRITVLAFTLDAADDATFSCTGTSGGFLRGAFPESDARWWTTAEAMLKDQAEHGLNAVTGGPGMALRTITDGKADIDFADADRWLAMATRYGLTRMGDSYQGLQPDLGFPVDTSKNALAVNEQRARERWKIGFPETIAAVYGTVAAHAAEKHWPARSYYLLDEPRIEFGNIESCRALIELFTKSAPGTAFSGFYSGGDGRDPYFSLMPVSIAHHDEATLAACVKAGKQGWTYDGGGSRFDAGRWFFVAHRTGMSGFLRNGWAYVNSDPYYDFSDTEGSWAQVYPSKAGFSATVLWERTADGISDYRYLKTLCARIAAAKKTGAAAAAIAAADAFVAATLAPITVADSRTAILTPEETAAFRAQLAKHITALAKP